MGVNTITKKNRKFMNYIPSIMKWFIVTIMIVVFLKADTAYAYFTWSPAPPYYTNVNGNIWLTLGNSTGGGFKSKWRTTPSFSTSGTFYSGNQEFGAWGVWYLHQYSTSGTYTQGVAGPYCRDVHGPNNPTISGPGGWVNYNPAITITHNGDVGSQGNDPVSGQVSYWEAGMNRIEYTWDQVNWGQVANGGSLYPTGEGWYNIWSRAFDAVGNYSGLPVLSFGIDKTAPNGSAYTVVTPGGYDVYVTGVTDGISGINKVQFPTWTDYNGQDDLVWNWDVSGATAGTNLGGGTWRYTVLRSDHGNNEGIYNTHVYIYDNAGNTRSLGVSYDAHRNAAITSNAPTSVNAGQTYTFQVTATNNGTLPWVTGSSYKLGLDWGSSAYPGKPASNRYELPNSTTINPGGACTWNITFTAGSSGSYNFSFKMLQEGVVWFGENWIRGCSVVSGNLYISQFHVLDDAGIVQTTLNVGQHYRIVTVTRNGGGSSVGGSITGLWNVTNAWECWRYDNTGILASGGQILTTTNYTPTTVGSYQWNACVDHSGLVAESNEDDNWSSITVNVVDTTLPTPSITGVTGADYQNGNNYWVKPGTQVSVKADYQDNYSLKLAYIRAWSTDAVTDVRRYIDWGVTQTEFMSHPNLVTGQGVDAGNSIWKTLLHASWPITTNSVEKDYYLESYATDDAGNVRGYIRGTQMLKVDSTAPTVPTITSNVTNWGNNNLTFSLAGGTDSRSGIKKYQYKTSEGIRNILQNSSNILFAANDVGLGTSTLMADSTGSFYRATPALGKPVSLYKFLNGFSSGLQVGGTYSFSFDARSNVATSMSNYIRNGASTATISVTDNTNLIANTWSRVTVDGFVCDSSSVNSLLSIISLSTVNATLDYRNLKLEQSAIASNYSTAPEDTSYNLMQDSGATYVGANEYVGVNITPIIQAHLGESITISADVSSSIAGSIGMYGLGGYRLGFNQSYSTTTSFKRISATGIPSFSAGDPNGNVATLSFYGVYGTGVKPTVKNIKVTVGSSNTVYSLPNIDSTWSDYSSAITISTEGTHTVSARSVDNVGNISGISTQTRSLDKTLPTVTANISSRVWGTAPQSVTLTYEDLGGSGLSTKEYYWSTSTTTPVTWTPYTGAVTQAGQGAWYLHYKATDVAGNIKTGYFGTYNIDLTAPTVTANVSSRPWDDIAQSVTLTYSDTGGSGVASSQYAWSTSTTVPSSWTNYVSPVSQATDGVWYLHYKNVDNAGNVTVGYFGSYGIDMTTPTVTADVSSRNWDDTQQTVNLTYSDAGGSLLSTKQYAWSTSTAVPVTWTNYTGAVSQAGHGQWYLHYKATDNAGNIKTGYFGIYKIDVNSGTVTASPSGRTWGNTNVSVALTYTDTDSGVSIKEYAWSLNSTTPTIWSPYVADVTQSAEGRWYLHYKITDVAGNIGTGYFNFYDIDKTVPTIVPNIANRPWGNTAVSVTLNYSDSLSGFGTKQYSWSNTTTAGAWLNYTAPVTQALQGIWYLHYTSTDVAGNTTTSYSGPYNIDLGVPTATAIPNSTPWDDVKPSVAITYTDALSGVQSKQYAWSLSTTTPVTWSDYTVAVSPVGEGVWYLHYKVVDVAGNIGIGYFGAYNVDLTTPVVTANIPNRAWATSDTSVTLTYSDSLSGISTKEYAWSLSTTTPSVWTPYTTPVVQSADGLWYLHYKTTDVAGNIKIGYFGTYGVDKTTGIVSAVPTSSPWRNTTQSVTLSYSDLLSGVSTKEYAWSTIIDTPTIWTPYTVPATQAVQGLWYLHYRIVDTAGNIKTGYFGTYNIDLTAPTVTADISSSAWSNSSKTVSLKYSDDMSGTPTREYAWSTSTTVPITWSPYTGPVVQSAQGEWYLHYRTVDGAGNVKVGYFGKYSIDLQLPVVTADVTNGSWGNTGKSVNLTYNDSLSGMAVREYAWSLTTTAPAVWSVYTTTVTQPLEGKWYLHYRATDIAGNVSVGYFGTYDIDLSIPTVIASENSSPWGNIAKSVTLTYSDTGGSGVSTKQYAWSTSATVPTIWNPYTMTVSQPLEGSWFLHYRTTDVAGNVKTGYLGTYDLDLTLPAVNADIVNRAWDNTTATVNLLYSDSLSGVMVKQYAWSTSTVTPTIWSPYTLAVSQPSDGIWYLHYKITDVAGNSKTGYFGTYNVDKGVPLVSADVTTRPWASLSQTVNLTFTDTLSGINTKQYAWSTSAIVPTIWSAYTVAVTQPADGLWYLHYKCTDISGNVTIGYFGTYGVDKTQGNVTADVLTRPWDKIGITVNLNYTDSASGVFSKGFAWSTSVITPTIWNAYSVAVSQPLEGVWYLHYKIIDIAGNIKTGYFGPYNIDTTNPSGILSPNFSTWTNSPTLLIGFDPSDSGGSLVKQWRYRTSSTNGVSWNLWSSYIVGDVNGFINLTGQYVWKIEVEITDNANNIGTIQSGSYQIDTTVPTGVFTPNSKPWTNSNIVVSFTPQDSGGSGLKQCRYATSSDNGVTWGAWGSYILGNNTATITLSSESEWKIKAEVTDNASNISTFISGTYQIDLTAPTIVFSPNGDAVPKLIHDVVVTATDIRSGVAPASLKYVWSDSTITPITGWASFNNGDTVSYTGVTGSYYLHIQASDNSGNVISTRSQAFNFIQISFDEFKITDIKDPTWKSVFVNSDETLTGTTFPISSMPITGEQNSISAGTEVKKGYSFYYSIVTKGLIHDNSFISIMPSFYYYDGTNRILVDMYYTLGENPIVLAGSPQDTAHLSYNNVDIGTLSHIILPKELRDTTASPQTWEGKYYIPATAVFVPKGDEPTEANILKDNSIIVNFVIEAIDSGDFANPKVVYNDSDWNAQGGPWSSDYLVGDVIQFDNSKSALDDFSPDVRY